VAVLPVRGAFPGREEKGEDLNTTLQQFVLQQEKKKRKHIYNYYKTKLDN